VANVILSMFVTLDGFISGPTGELDWLPESDDTSNDVIDTLENADGILLGHTTYTVFEQYWPTAASDPRTYPADIHVAERLNALPKYVFSSEALKVAWQNTTVVTEPPEHAAAELKRENPGNLVVFGGADLFGSLMAAGLIDELRLSVAPVLLGDGTSLFTGTRPRRDLTLVEAKQMEPGFVRLHYRL
jgi:dihydrofolate reductase